MTLRSPLGALGALSLSAGLALLLSSGAMAQGLGNSFNGLQVQGDQPISIESNQLDVDDSKAMATFSGNVAVAQGDTQIKTSKLVVFYAKPAEGEKKPGEDAPAKKPAASAMPGGSSQIDRIQASGKVYIRSADQVATAETADFNMKTQIAVLNGNVVLSQGDNVVRGPKLTIYMDTGVAKFEGGRTKILLSPDQKPEAVAGQ